MTMMMMISSKQFDCASRLAQRNLFGLLRRYDDDDDK